MIMVPYHRLYPAILMFCAIGVFSLNNAEFDVYLMALFGLFGYVCAKLDLEPAPMLLGFIIGPMMEEYLRRALLLSHSDPTVFVTRPISATMLALAAIALAVVMSPTLRKKRGDAESLSVWPGFWVLCSPHRQRHHKAGPLPKLAAHVNFPSQNAVHDVVDDVQPQP
jgi:TctA family transporter